MKRDFFRNIEGKVTNIMVITMLLFVICSNIFIIQNGDLFVKGDAENWWNNDWDYRKLITINSSLVDATLTNFPILVNTTADSDLNTYAQADGDDITFILYSDNTTQLNHEIESYDSGSLNAWVNVTSLSHTVNTKIWMYYNNSECESQENVTNTWDANFQSVWHFAYDGDLNDSTGRYTNANVTNTGVTFTSDGPNGWCLEYDDDDDKLNISDFDDLGGTFTAEMFLQRNANATSGYNRIFTEGLDHEDNDWCVYMRTPNDNWRYTLRQVGLGDKGTLPGLDFWWYYSVTGDDPNNEWYMYGNTTKIYESTTETIKQTGYDNMFIIGDNGTGASANGMVGYVDEVRFSTVERSQEWCNASYNTFLNKDSFITFGEPLGIGQPTNSNPYPSQNAEDIPLTPSTLNITVSDPNGDLMNVTFRTNASGSWEDADTNTSVSNGTYYCLNTTWINEYQTTYWWSVNTSDGTGYWDNDTFYFLTLSNPSSGTSYYVSNTGNNDNDGLSTETPWQTIAKVNAEFGENITAGDDVYFKRGDTFNDAGLEIDISGESTSNPTIIGAYGSGARPKFTPDTNLLPTIDLTDAENVTIEYLHLEPTDSEGAITSEKGSHYIKIQNVFMHGDDYRFGAIYFKDDDNAGADDSSHIIIRNCTISDTETDSDTSEGISTESVSYMLIENNTIYNSTHTALYLYGENWLYSDDGAWIIVRNNTINSYRRAFGVTFWQNHTLIENNNFSSIYDAGKAGSGDQFLGSNSAIVRNNLYNNYHGSADGKMFSGTVTATGDETVKDIAVYHNTYYTASKDGANYATSEIPDYFTFFRNLAEDTSNINNVSILNNIVHQQESKYVYFLDNDVALEFDDMEFKNNLIYFNTSADANIFRFEGGDDNGYYDISDVQGGSPPNPDWVTFSGSTWADPDMSMINFTLNATSPAINNASWLTNTTASKTSDWVDVSRSYFFYPRVTICGEVQEGDIIFVGNDDNLEVIDINYDNDSLQVNRSITYSAGDDVSLSDYEGDAPDIGAFESEYETEDVEPYTAPTGLTALSYNDTKVSLEWKKGHGNGTHVLDYLYVDDFIKSASNPIINASDTGNWAEFGIRENALMTNSTGYLVKENGNYTIFFNGRNTTGTTTTRVGRGTSSDGINWDLNSSYVFNDTSGNFYTMLGSVVKRGENDYIMYYTVHNETAKNIVKFATSTNGYDWTAQRIIFNLTNFTNANSLGIPNVVYFDGEWHMVLEGANSSGGGFNIFYANSSDAENWTEIADPIYKNTTGWDAEDVANPHLLKLDTNKYVMFYDGANPSYEFQLGILYSTSVTSGWTSWENNPIIEHGPDAWDLERIEGGRVYMDDIDNSTLRLWYFGLDDSGQSIRDGAIGYATCNDTLSNTLVRYSTSNNLSSYTDGIGTIYNGTLSYATKTGLSPSTIYWVRAWTWNATTGWNTTGSNTISFTTDSGETPLTITNPYPADTATSVGRPPTNLSAQVNGSSIDVYIYFKNLTGLTYSWDLVETWSSSSTGRHEYTDFVTDYSMNEFLWGNTTYTWSVNATNDTVWINETYIFTTVESAGGNDARKDIQNDNDVDITDCILVYNYYDNGNPYNKFYDTQDDNDVDIFDCILIYNEYN